MDHGKIVLMKDCQTPVAQQGRTVSQDAQGIRRMNENVTADDRVELTVAPLGAPSGAPSGAPIGAVTR